MRRAAFALISSAALACSSRSTEIVLHIESDAPREEITRFVVEATSDSGRRDSAEFDRTGMPETLGVLPADGDPEDGVTLVVKTIGDKTLETRRHLDTFLAGRVLHLYICVSERCRASTSTCTPSFALDGEFEDLEALTNAGAPADFAADCRPAPPPIPDPDGGLPDEGPIEPPDGGDAGDAGDTEDAGDAGVPEDGSDAVVAWGRRIGGVADDQVFDVTFDSRGNVITSGAFRDRVDFAGSGHVAMSADHDEGFIASYGPDGAERWFVQIESERSKDSRMWAIAVGPNDDIFVSGLVIDDFKLFGDSIAVDPPMGEKGQPDGEMLLLRLRPGTSSVSVADVAFTSEVDYQSGRAIAVADDGTVIFAGNFNHTFGIRGCTFEQPNNSMQNVFVGALDSTLSTCLWRHVYHSPANDTVEELKVARINGRNVVYMSGEIQGNLSIDNVMVQPIAGPEDIYLSALSVASGAVLQTIRVGGIDGDDDPRLSIDGPGGRVLMAAQFPNHDALTVGAVLVPLAGDAAVGVELDEMLLHRSTIMPESDTDGVLGGGVAALPDGRAVFGGRFYGSISIGTGMHTTTSTARDIFITTTRGAMIGDGVVFGGEQDDNLLRLAATPAAIVAVGTYVGPMTLPNGRILERAGARDVFVYYLPVPAE